MNGLPIREDLRDERPYGAPQLAVPVVLNVNENPYPPSEALVADAVTAVADVVRSLNRYPDREATQLRADLARYLEQESGVTVETRQVWAANGSNEIMQQVLQAFGGTGRVAMSFTPTYSMYPEYARNTNTGYVAVPRAEDFSIDLGAAREAIATHRPSVIMVASPNNPTGTAVDLDLISELHARTDGIVVVDEAYAEFRRAGTASAATLVPTHPRLIVTRTMSKAFAFAGARVGYAVAPIPVIDALRIVRLPYHLSAVTQVVARVALAHVDELQADVATLRTDRDALAEWLLWNGFEAPPSDANFILFGPFADRHAVWQGLVDRGVLVREVGPDGWLRVSIGRPEETAAFKSALLRVVEALGGGEDTEPVQPAEPVQPVARRVVPDEVPPAADRAAPDPAVTPVAAADGREPWPEPETRAESGAGPEPEATVESVGSKLQALRGEDVDATVLDGMGVDVDLPDLEPVRDADERADDTTDGEAADAPPADGDAAMTSVADGDATDTPATPATEEESGGGDDAGSGGGDDTGDPDEQAADDRDEKVALAVLRDQAESAADQLTGRIMDEERR